MKRKPSRASDSQGLSEQYRELFEVAGLVFARLDTQSKVEALKLQFPVDVRESTTPRDPDALVANLREHVLAESIALKDAALQESEQHRRKRNRPPTEKTTRLAAIIRDLRLHRREKGGPMTWSRVTSTIRRNHPELLTPEQQTDYFYALQSFQRIFRDDTRRREGKSPRATRRKPASMPSGATH